MRVINYNFIVFVVTIFLGLLFYFPTQDKQENNIPNPDKIRSSSSPKASIEMKKGRWEYFNRMLRDPATGQIPKGIRQKELAFAKELQQKNNSLQKTVSAMELGWKEAGPNDVGGRTRALAVDVNDPNTIIVGGVSGGIWKSTDKGVTWQMKSTTSQILSVTTLAQDPRTGHTNTWYYGTGESLWGNSSQAQGRTAMFCGDGIYKSTDNGETWNILPITNGTDPTKWNKVFDFVYKIIINPTTGSILVATFGHGIFQSKDGGDSFTQIFGEPFNHFYSDIDVASNGTLIIAVSSTWNDVTPKNPPGIYKSTDDGANWTTITPNNFPATHERSVLAIAPSAPSIVYILTNTGKFLDPEEKVEEIVFFKININNGSSEDRSQNLPNFDAPHAKGRINTQWNYDMVIAVKPDNENFVMIAGTSLFKSEDGFATKLTDPLTTWIGGYSANENHFPFYPNFHPDIHSFAFSANNPNEMWWGHDGGLTYTDQLNVNSYTEQFPWSNMNNGYNVTQFYTISISSAANDNRIMGGTQDNGTPFFTFDGNITSPYFDASLADGAYCHLGKQYAYTSIQNGLTYRIGYDQNGTPFEPWGNEQFAVVSPSGASNQLFINPFVIDPNDENIMYYLSGNVVWRNNALSSIPDNNWDNTSIGWTELVNTKVPDGYTFSTLASSNSNPSHVLYFGASSSQTPKIYKLTNANTNTNAPSDISIAGLSPGAYIHNIAVNPDNGNELIVVLSNYNIVGLYHSNNGGQSFTAIEGNLEGTQNNPGPSIRAATILPTSNGTLYLVATSTGVYSTTQLNGAQTNWTLESGNVIGNVVVNYITSRKSDGRIVVGTHGRGAFVGQADAAGTAVAVVTVQTLSLQSRPGETGTASFELKNDGEANLNFNVSVSGNFGGALPKSGNNNYIMYNRKSNKNTSFRFENRKVLEKYSSNIGIISQAQNLQTNSSPSEVAGNDVLKLDDGDNAADNFYGWVAGASDIYWYNEFNLTTDFQLETIRFFMRSGQSSENVIYAAVYDQDINQLAGQDFSLDLAPNGNWFTITLNSPITFSSSETFYIEISSFSSIDKPIGVDIDGKIPNKSFYGDGFTYYNLNTTSGLENGAFLIRAIGKAGSSGSNQDPIAVAQVLKFQVEVNESITFSASQSYDNDGNITQYSWNFGDGNTSTQQTVDHAYTQANTFNYTLTVTDNQGSTGQTSGQIIVSDASNQYVTVQPSSGTITPGGSQTITLTLDAQSINEGTYSGQVNIATNGGNITIPIDYLVDIEKSPSVPTEFSLSQNYPNPFNPTTTIQYSIPVVDAKFASITNLGNKNIRSVQLKVYDILGKEVATLVNEEKSAGSYEVNFDGSNLVSGIYIYRLEADNFIDTKKLVLLK